MSTILLRQRVHGSKEGCAPVGWVCRREEAGTERARSLKKQYGERKRPRRKWDVLTVGQENPPAGVAADCVCRTPRMMPRS